jgi:hypothetical protein
MPDICKTKFIVIILVIAFLCNQLVLPAYACNRLAKQYSLKLTTQAGENTYTVKVLSKINKNSYNVQTIYANNGKTYRGARWGVVCNEIALQLPVEEQPGGEVFFFLCNGAIRPNSIIDATCSLIGTDIFGDPFQTGIDSMALIAKPTRK